MIILVTGGRDNSSITAATEALRPFAQPGHLLIHGNATGWDQTCALIWTEVFQLPAVAVPARWDQFGKMAGPTRNESMVSGNAISPHALLVPDVVIRGRGGHGTADCVARARKAGIPVVDAQ